MFDRTFIQAGPRAVHHYSNVTIDERRAPTDESVKLLKEMQEKAKAEVTAAVHVADTAVDSVMQAAVRFEQDALDLRVVFSLNGNKMTATHTFHGGDDVSPKAVQEAITAAVSQKIAQFIYAKSLTPEIVRQLWRR